MPLEPLTGFGEPAWPMARRAVAADFYVDTRFGVLHEDEHIVVLDKPAPLAVHPVGAYADLNLHSLMKRDVRWADASVRFVHRLDAETSGVIVAAKTPEAARSLGIQFLGGSVRKTYLGFVFGSPEEAVGEIDLPLGYDESSGFQTVRTFDPLDGEPASTRYRVVKSGERFSLLEITPLTGRTHQIRAHLSLAGHPLVGDKIYIDLEIFQRYVRHGLDPAMVERVGLRRLALHASRLEFTHPSTRQAVAFEAPLPEALSSIEL